MWNPNWFLTLKNFYLSLFSKWPPQYRKISTLSDIITIWYVYEMALKSDNVEFVWYCGSHFVNDNGRNFSMSGINSGHHYLPTYQILIDSWHWKISTGLYFQNGHHNIAKIQHCPISSQFDMWVDNDVKNWFSTLNNFYCLPFSKWPPILMMSDNVEFLRYCGGHFENGDQ
jgi:hypothetical protein